MMMDHPLTPAAAAANHNHSHPQQQQQQFTCAGCGGAILDQYVLRVAPDMEWHAECLRCADCRQQLDESCTCFVRDGKVFCKPDYVRLYGTRCARCHERFAKNDLVMRAKSNIYHVDCFRCSACSRQLVSGDEFSLREDARLLCKVDHEAAYSNNNNNSGGGLNGVALVAGNLVVNGDCGANGTGSGFVGGDESIVDDVIVAGSNNNNDVDGKNGGSDDASSTHSDSGSPSLPTPAGGRTSNAHRSANGPAFQHQQPQHGGGHGHGRGRSGGGHHHHHRGSGHHGNASEQKTTRIRTVLNEKQLHTLRTCYSANSRPDALMKEQLVEMTGLSPRVIRVWFQNKRCKDKKRSIALKQLHQQHQNKSDKLDVSWLAQKGVPLIATSPVRHEPPHNLLPTPVEVHKYAAPWTTDFNPDDVDDIPSPPSGGLHQQLQLPPSLALQAAALRESGGGGFGLGGLCGPGSASFGDSFDDDTVVSFDDLSDVVSNPGSGRFVASAPPLPATHGSRGVDALFDGQLGVARPASGGYTIVDGHF